MICMTGRERNLTQLRERISKHPEADLHEVRLDFLDPLPSREALGALPRLDDLVVACRPRWEGGGFDGEETQRVEHLVAAARAGVRYVDIEWRAAPEIRRRLFRHLHPYRRILSCHTDGASAVRLLPEMEGEPVGGIKLVVPVEGGGDLLELGRLRSEKLLFLMGSGELGRVTRLAYPLFGSRGTFVTSTPEAATDAAQPSAQEILDFGLREVSPETRWIGMLCGRRARTSRGVRIYNPLLREKGFDVRYIQLPIDDLEHSAALLRSGRFLGASVTIPHKEQILPLLDRVGVEAREIGAVNTIVVDGETLVGENTDAVGFLAALGRHCDPAGATAAVLGAGGAARAIVHALLSAGANVKLFNRSEARRKELSRAFGVAAAPLEEAKEGAWNLLVSTIPESAVAASLLPASPLTDKTVFDITLSEWESPLVREARARGASVIRGIEMWAFQGREQLRRWLGFTPPADLLIERAETIYGERRG
ncbi:MAG: type I 3-dehydroquinate dehydratase [Deltaproteobacteria bacterium]|nr:MAG: type I 3-dehydroquinate dehydratase [Deltaproteobacteria bacterium]